MAIYRIVYYLMNIKVVPRAIYLSRHGQSDYNSLKKLGGDSDLTDCGEDYSRSEIGPEIWLLIDLLFVRKLGSYINSIAIDNIVVWTSWLKRSVMSHLGNILLGQCSRTIQTAQHIEGPQERWKTLNEIDAGDLDGLSYDEIKVQFPEEYSCRHGDKFMYRSSSYIPFNIMVL